MNPKYEQINTYYENNSYLQPYSVAKMAALVCSGAQ